MSSSLCLERKTSLVPIFYERNFANPAEILWGRYPDEEAGQIPMAFVVRKPGSNINADEVMDFVAKQVCICICMSTFLFWNFRYLKIECVLFS